MATDFPFKADGGDEPPQGESSAEILAPDFDPNNPL
jgi:hypothetical protein